MMNSIEFNELIKRLNSQAEEEKLYAIDDLGNIEDEGVYEVLVGCLKKETSQIVKDSILYALKGKLSGGSFQRVFELFNSDDAYIRNAAVSIFSSAGADTILFLENRFAESNKEVKKLILDALFEIGTNEAGRLIARAIWDEAPNVRITAIEYIGRLGLEDSQQDVLAVFEQEDEPMLVLSILMSLQFFQNFRYISRITKKLCPAGDMKDLNELYLGELLKLIARFGDKDEILKIISDMHDDTIKSQELIEILIIATGRFRELSDSQAVKDLLISCLQNPAREEKTIYNLFHIMNKSNDPKIMKITEEFMSDPKSGLNEFCAAVVRALKLNKE